MSALNPMNTKLLEQAPTKQQTTNWDDYIETNILQAPKPTEWVWSIIRCFKDDQKLLSFFSALKEKIRSPHETARTCIEEFLICRDAFETAFQKIFVDRTMPVVVRLEAAVFFFNFYESIKNKRPDSLNEFISKTCKPLQCTSQEIQLLFVLYIKQIILPVDSSNRLSFFEEAIGQILLFEHECDWLSFFLDEDSPHTLAEDIIACLNHKVNTVTILKNSPTYKIYERYCQIIGVNHQQETISQKQALQMAYYIVKKVPETISFLGACFQKTDFSPHIYADPLSGFFYVTPKNCDIIPYRYSDNGKACTVIRIPFMATLAPSFATEMIGTSKNIRKLRKESQVQQLLTGNRGIWPLFTVYSCTNCDKQRIRVLSPPATSTLEAIYKDDLLSLPDRIAIIKDLAHGLEWIHRKSFFYGNVSLKHVAIEKEPNGRIKAGWTCLYPCQKIASGDLNFYLKKGTCPSPFYTPPEVYGNQEFTGNPYKVDIWAFGQLCYELLSKAPAPWVSLINKGNDEWAIKLEKASLYNSLHEIAFNIPQKKINDSAEDYLYRLATKMLSIMPSNRPATMIEVLEEVDIIQSMLQYSR